MVETIPLMHDNYCYLVITPSTREAIVVDVCDAETVLAVLKRRQLTLTAILTTHGAELGHYEKKKKIFLKYLCVTICQFLGRSWPTRPGWGGTWTLHSPPHTRRDICSTSCI